MQEPTLGPTTSSNPDRVGGVSWERATIEKLVQISPVHRFGYVQHMLTSAITFLAKGALEVD